LIIIIRKNKIERSWLSLDTKQSERNRGHLVFVGNYDYCLSDGNLNIDGSVVEIASDAQVEVAQKNDTQCIILEDKVS